MPGYCWRANCKSSRRVTGLAVALKLPIAPAIVAQAFEAGLLLNAPRADTLRFMPALNVARVEILEMIDGLDAILTREGAARRVA